jgi:MFS family permease
VGSAIDQERHPMPVAISQSVYPRPFLAWFTVGLLTLAYILSFIDRQILSLLVAPIRRDLAISDTQMSLLMGFSFAVFYTLCGIPMGRLADVASRRWVVTWGVAFWSIATAACGLAHHYWQLFLGRVGVGVGEAALSPASYSLIADSFPPERRATATSVFATGIFIGSGLAYVVGGVVVGFAMEQGQTVLPWIGPTRPWQLVFYLLGGAGLMFAWLVLLIREPTRKGVTAGSKAVPFRDVVKLLMQHRYTVLLHNFGFAGTALALYSINAWIPSVWQRVHGWEVREVGVIYGSIVAVVGTFGIVLGGWLADRWRAKGMSDATLRVGAIGSLCGAPLSLAIAFMPSGSALAVLMIPITMFVAMPLGVAASAIQDLVPNGMRGQTSAIYLFIVNLVGLGLGPTAVALVTDRVFGNDSSVHLSLALVVATAQILGFVLLSRGRAHFRSSLERIEGRS